MMRLRALLVLPALATMTGCGSQSDRQRSTGTVHVVASIFPLADMVRQVGGPRVDVACLLAPGRSPHDYEPGAEQREAVGHARLIVMVGMGIDEWAAKVAATAGRETRVLKVTEHPDFAAMLRAAGTEPVGAEEAQAHTRPGQPAHEDEDEHEHGAFGRDPHVWLDPVFMQVFARAVAEALGQVDPPGGQEYLRRCDEYVGQLQALDREYRQTLLPFTGRGFVTFHAAFGCLAARYGLKQVALHGPDAGGFGADRLESLVRFVRDNNVKVIFAEPQFPLDKVEVLARRTGASVGRLDPEGNPNVRGYDSYLAMMRSNLKALAEGLGR